MIDVVALGELLIDFAAKSTDTSGYPTMAANPGGAPGNFLAALNAYGKKTAFLGKVGNDAFGHLLLGTLKAAGIETKSVVVDDSVFTTLAFVTFDENGDRSFSFARKPGADTQLTWEEIDKSLIDDARVFHFGTLSLTDEPVRTATQRAVAYAKEKGKLITCDPNLRKPLWPSEDAAREQMLWSLRQADVVKISDNEVEFLWNCTPEEGADKLLKEFGVSLALVTLGPEGCLLKTENASFRAVCPKVHPIDTTGAGDIFGGLHWQLCCRRCQPVHGSLRRHPQHPGKGCGFEGYVRKNPEIPQNFRVSSRLVALGCGASGELTKESRNRIMRTKGQNKGR